MNAYDGIRTIFVVCYRCAFFMWSFDSAFNMWLLQLHVCALRWPSIFPLLVQTHKEKVWSRSVNVHPCRNGSKFSWIVWIKFSTCPDFIENWCVHVFWVANNESEVRFQFFSNKNWDFFWFLVFSWKISYTRLWPNFFPKVFAQKGKKLRGVQFSKFS